MKVIINLFNAFNFFRIGLAKPLFSLKPIIIFSNVNPKKKDWEQSLQNLWNPTLLEIQNVLKPQERLFISPKMINFKSQTRPKVNGLFELRNFY